MAGVEVSLRAARERERGRASERGREEERGRAEETGRVFILASPLLLLQAAVGGRGAAGGEEWLVIGESLRPSSRERGRLRRRCVALASCRLRFAVHAGWRGGAEECICCVVGRRVRLSVAVGGWREDLTRARPVGAGQREARTHAVSLCGCGVGGRERKKCARGRGGGAEERRPRERGRGRVRWLASGLCPCPCFGRFGVCGVVGVCEFSWEGCVCVFRAGMRQGEGKSEESSVGRE